MKYELMWQPTYGDWDGVMFDDRAEAEAWYERLAAKPAEYRRVELTERATGRILRTIRPQG